MSSRALQVLFVSLALVAGLGSAATAAPTAAPPPIDTRAASATPGVQGRPLVLANNADLRGYDIGVDAAGTTYIGWIASPASVANRAVHLCVLPLGATACRGGIQSRPSLGISSAAGLRVVVPSSGPVTLVWFHDTVDSVNGPLNARIATATVVSGVLGAPQDRAAAPSFGSLATAVAGPGGSIWAVLRAGSGGDNTTLSVLPGLDATPEPIATGLFVGPVSLAFQGVTPVLTFGRVGAVSDPLRVTSRVGGVWSTPRSVAGTWTLGQAFGSVAVGGVVHLVSSVANASYEPQIATWRGSAFGPARRTGQGNTCSPFSHDLVTDRSGRIADVTRDCNNLAVINQPTRGPAATVRFPIGGTAAGGDPQIATTARGLGWVAWSRLSGSTGNTLLAQPVRLPALLTTKTRRTRVGRVRLTGPVSCMPAVNARARLRAKGLKKWKVSSQRLLLDGKRLKGTLQGARLKPGSRHRLVGRVAFTRAGTTKRINVTLRFTACAAN